MSEEGEPSSDDDLYVVESNADAMRIVRTRPYTPAGQPRDWVALAGAVAAWALACLAGMTVGGVFLRLAVAIPAMGLAWRCFDTETYRGRRRMRRELVFETGTDEGGYRETPGLRPVRMDDEELPRAGAWELIVVKWARWSDDSRSWQSELALVMGSHVRVIASELVSCDRSDVPRSPPPPEEYWASAIDAASSRDRVAQFVERLPAGLRAHVKVDELPRTTGAGSRLPAGNYGIRLDPWLSYGEFIEGCQQACFILSFAAASFLAGVASRHWGIMGYLAICAFLVLSLQRFVYVSGIRGRAPAALRAVFGDHVTPLPGAIPCRPGLALLLGLVVMIASGLGLVGPYRDRVRGHEHRAADAPSSTPAPDDRPH